MATRMNASNAPETYILTLSCLDTVGIVAAISGQLAETYRRLYRSTPLTFPHWRAAV